MMRLAVAALVLLGGCTLATMDGFDTLAPEGEQVELTGIPGWQDGNFRLGHAEGHVRRRAVGATHEWRDDPWGDVTQAVVERTGPLAFDLSGAEAGGRVEGRCRYGRGEVQQHFGGLSVSAVGQPLRVACAYRIDGRDAGGMDLSAIPSAGPTLAEPRAGVVEIDGVALEVRSRHRMTGGQQPLDAPIGYVLSDSDGRVVGAIETNGTGTRRLILPRSAEERRIAVAALVTLALFWDPGNTD